MFVSVESNWYSVHVSKNRREEELELLLNSIITCRGTSAEATEMPRFLDIAAFYLNHPKLAKGTIEEAETFRLHRFGGKVRQLGKKPQQPGRSKSIEELI